MTKAEETLWNATETGQYPPGTTAQNLIQVKNEDGWTALHWAAQKGHLPKNTTAKDLAATKNNEGWSALHSAARAGSLPPDTDVTLLKATKDNTGYSAWNALCLFLEYQPTQVLPLPHHLFANDHFAAILAVNNAIQTDRSLTKKATIWLGQVLAQQPSQPLQTTKRPTP